MEIKRKFSTWVTFTCATIVILYSDFFVSFIKLVFNQLGPNMIYSVILYKKNMINYTKNAFLLLK